MPFLTVLTATYNRAYCLENAYQSLKNQTDKDFEWIIVDDGSSDETAHLVRNWQEQDNDFEIKYVYQENAGKMQAVNNGVSLAKGMMVLTLDSDDALVTNAVEIVKKYENSIQDKSAFAGVAGAKCHFDGRLVGSSFDGTYIDCTTLQRRKNNITGDKAEVFYTEILKKYPFPKFNGEKFVPEALVFNRIANDSYKLRWFNENIYLCEYLEDGYTKNVNRNLIKNWQGYSLYVKELMTSKASLSEKIIPLCGYIYRSALKAMKKF